MYTTLHALYSGCSALSLRLFAISQSVSPKVGKRSRNKNGDKSNTSGKGWNSEHFLKPNCICALSRVPRYLCEH